MLAVDPEALPALSERSSAIRELYAMTPRSRAGAPVLLAAAEALGRIEIPEDEEAHILACLRARYDGESEGANSVKDG